MREFAERYVGPASYMPEHKLTEARTDIGVKTMQDDANPPDELEDDRMMLFPNYDQIQNNKLGVPFPGKPGDKKPDGLESEKWADKPTSKNNLEFKWKLPTPQTHIRQEDIDNIHWRYYDVNLN